MASFFSKCACTGTRNGKNRCIITSAWVTLCLCTIVVFVVIVIQILVVLKMLPFVLHSLILFFSTLFNYCMTVFITLLVLSKVQKEDQGIENQDDSLQLGNLGSTQSATDEFVHHAQVRRNNAGLTSTYNRPPPYDNFEQTAIRNIRSGKTLSNPHQYRCTDSRYCYPQDNRHNKFEKQESSRSSNCSESSKRPNPSPTTMTASQQSSFQSRNMTTLDVPRDRRIRSEAERYLDRNNSSLIDSRFQNKVIFPQVPSPSRNIGIPADHSPSPKDQIAQRNLERDLDCNNPSDLSSILDQQIEELKNFSENLRHLKENMYANLPPVSPDAKHNATDHNSEKTTSQENLQLQNCNIKTGFKPIRDDYGKLISIHQSEDSDSSVLDNANECKNVMYEHKGMNLYDHRVTSLNNLDKVGDSSMVGRKAKLQRMAAISEEIIAKPAALAKPFVRNQKSSDDIPINGKSLPNLVDNCSQKRAPNYFELEASQALSHESDEQPVVEAVFKANYEAQKINEMLSLYNRKMRQNIRNLNNNGQKESNSAASGQSKGTANDIANTIIRF